MRIASIPRLLLTGGLGLTLAFGLATAAHAAGTGTVTGTVRDDVAAVGAGVVVTARTPQDEVLATATTDDTGTYTLTGVPSGLRVICFDGAAATTRYPAGYLFGCSGGARSAATADPVRVVAGRENGYDAQVRPATVVTGRVTDPAGQALTDVDVAVDYNAPPVATATDGVYRSTLDVAYSDYITPCFDGVRATGGSSAAGYTDACYSRNGGPSSLLVERGRIYQVDFVLRPASAISGRVTDRAGNPLAGVEVSVNPANSPGTPPVATTAADGTYTVTGVSGGLDVGVRFDTGSATGGTSTAGYVPQCFGGGAPTFTSCPPDRFHRVRTRAGQISTGVSVALQAASGISGRVTDGERPIPDVEVQASGRGGFQTATTGPDGTFRMTGLDPHARLTVCFRNDSLPDSNWPNPDGYESACRTGPSGRPVLVPLTPGAVTPDVDLALVGRGGIAGLVVDGAGQPLSGVNVTFTARDPGGRDLFDVWTDEAGTFRGSFADPGRYAVCVSSGSFGGSDRASYGLVPQCRRVTVTSGAVTTVPTITMAPAGGILGHVTDTSGFALDGVAVSVSDATTGLPVGSSQTYADGYRIQGLAPGRYTVCFDGRYAHRTADYGAPRKGYASQCFDHVVDGAPTPVLVQGGQGTSGIDARLAVARG